MKISTRLILHHVLLPADLSGNSHYNAAAAVLSEQWWLSRSGRANDGKRTNKKKQRGAVCRQRSESG